MKAKLIYPITIVVLIVIIIVDHNNISELKEKLRTEQRVHHYSLLEFHNFYTSQMDSLKHHFYRLRNDESIGRRDLYRDDVTVDHKLSSVRDFMHLRNTLYDSIVKETAEYVGHAKNEFRMRNSSEVYNEHIDRMYSRIIKENEDGKVTLIQPSFVSFDIKNIKKYKVKE